MDPSEVLFHLLIGCLSEKIDVVMFYQLLPLVAERNLQAMGATDCLEGTKNNIDTLQLCKQHMQQGRGLFTLCVLAVQTVVVLVKQWQPNSCFKV